MDRRGLNRSSETYNPPFSPTFERDLDRSLQLLNLLHQVDDLPESSTVASSSNETELARMLSIHSVVSTSSSAASRHHTAQKSNTKEFRKIGAGACGAIFSPDGTSLSYKLAKVPLSNELWNDAVMHLRIMQKMRQYGIVDVKVPDFLAYFGQQETDFWQQNTKLRQAAEEVCHLPTHVFVTERIMPLPQATRASLINQYCSSRNKQEALDNPANKDCLVRIYLGSTKGRSNMSFFSLRNFKLHLNQMVELGLDVESMARNLGSVLAVMHWGAKTDARDIEFVLGSTTNKGELPDVAEVEQMAPNSKLGHAGPQPEDFYHRKTVIWVLDFNQVRRITMNEAGVAQAVEAFKVNDPYYPRPLQNTREEQITWNAFVRSYLQMASRILADEKDAGLRDLPILFVQSVVDMQKAKQAQ